MEKSVNEEIEKIKKLKFEERTIKENELLYNSIKGKTPMNILMRNVNMNQSREATVADSEKFTLKKYVEFILAMRCILGHNVNSMISAKDVKSKNLELAPYAQPFYDIDNNEFYDLSMIVNRDRLGALVFEQGKQESEGLAEKIKKGETKSNSDILSICEDLSKVTGIKLNISTKSNTFVSSKISSLKHAGNLLGRGKKFNANAGTLFLDGDKMSSTTILTSYISLCATMSVNTNFKNFKALLLNNRDFLSMDLEKKNEILKDFSENYSKIQYELHAICSDLIASEMTKMLPKLTAEERATISNAYLLSAVQRINGLENYVNDPYVMKFVSSTVTESISRFDANYKFKALEIKEINEELGYTKINGVNDTFKAIYGEYDMGNAGPMNYSTVKSVEIEKNSVKSEAVSSSSNGEKEVINEFSEKFKEAIIKANALKSKIDGRPDFEALGKTSSDATSEEKSSNEDKVEKIEDFTLSDEERQKRLQKARDSFLKDKEQERLVREAEAKAKAEQEYKEHLDWMQHVADNVAKEIAEQERLVKEAEAEAEQQRQKQEDEAIKRAKRARVNLVKNRVKALEEEFDRQNASLIESEISKEQPDNAIETILIQPENDIVNDTNNIESLKSNIFNLMKNLSEGETNEEEIVEDSEEQNKIIKELGIAERDAKSLKEYLESSTKTEEKLNDELLNKSEEKDKTTPLVIFKNFGYDAERGFVINIPDRKSTLNGIVPQQINAKENVNPVIKNIEEPITKIEALEDANPVITNFEGMPTWMMQFTQNVPIIKREVECAPARNVGVEFSEKSKKYGEKSDEKIRKEIHNKLVRDTKNVLKNKYKNKKASVENALPTDIENIAVKRQIKDAQGHINHLFDLHVDNKDWDGNVEDLNKNLHPTFIPEIIEYKAYYDLVKLIQDNEEKIMKTYISLKNKENKTEEEKQILDKWNDCETLPQFLNFYLKFNVNNELDKDKRFVDVFKNEVRQICKNADAKVRAYMKCENKYKDNYTVLNDASRFVVLKDNKCSVYDIVPSNDGYKAVEIDIARKKEIGKLVKCGLDNYEEHQDLSKIVNKEIEKKNKKELSNKDILNTIRYQK